MTIYTLFFYLIFLPCNDILIRNFRNIMYVYQFFCRMDNFLRMYLNCFKYIIK